MKRDNKDPMPMAQNSARDGGGNDPTKGGEKHGQKLAEKVTAASRDLSNNLSPEQPERNKGGKTTQHGVPQSGGNVPVTHAAEKHGQKKAQRISGSTERW